jgi:hypothetical protein
MITSRKLPPDFLSFLKSIETSYLNEKDPIHLILTKKTLLDSPVLVEDRFAGVKSGNRSLRQLKRMEISWMYVVPMDFSWSV